jgi:hypothetical protein
MIVRLSCNRGPDLQTNPLPTGSGIKAPGGGLDAKKARQSGL